jgi:hypothetical protein
MGRGSAVARSHGRLSHGDVRTGIVSMAIGASERWLPDQIGQPGRCCTHASDARTGSGPVARDSRRVRSWVRAVSLHGAASRTSEIFEMRERGGGTNGR